MSDNRVKTNVNDRMIAETARDYAAFVQVDLPSQTGGVHEAVDEMLIRLEEFESIVGMVQNLRAECTFEHLVRFRSVHPALMELCKRIDALERVVARASVDLVSLETAVEAAEAELGGNATVSDRLFGILNPLSLFKSKNQEGPASATSSPSSPKQEPLAVPTIYRTEDAFNTSQ
ncbi:biogenesis of lysosome-related organelles complex 1 subunit 4 [Diachasma alloeum]|uniref:biogenesis of lysosome-related organelles complex 1 subunit 4 n=1 Tax=Diachasma alloeum TaxID=454923 RepID=UPI00073823DA|nr:biogenesis of lysosome-related organelles complex 1 subunit 4 [Diachasma alloeum]